MIDILFLTAFGVLTGFFTGITPGIHPNTVIFSSLPFYFSFNLEFLHFMTFLAGLSVSHTFHDFLPAIFLGAPEAETAMASLPGVEKAAKGGAVEAFHYTLFGGTFAVLSMVMIAPIVLIFLKPLYSALKPFMGFILVFFLTVLITDSDDKFSAVIVALLSGLLGLISFSMPVNSQYVLIPVFSGLFAVPAVITAFKSSHKLPEQKDSEVSGVSAARGGLIGSISGIFTGIFPGMSPAVSTSFLTPFMERSEEFLAAMGGVNSADILMTFLALHLIGKARSGAAIALSSISNVQSWEIVFLAGVSILSISLSLLLSFKSPFIFLKILRKLSVKKVLVLVMAIIVLTVLWLTGAPGILILATAGFIGYYAGLKDQRRLTMSVLLIPSILYFTGYSGFI